MMPRRRIRRQGSSFCALSVCVPLVVNITGRETESDGAPLTQHWADNGKSCPASCVAELVEAGTSFLVHYQCVYVFVCVDTLD